MPDDRTPNADELNATTPKNGPGTEGATSTPRPGPDAKDQASNEQDKTQGS